MSGAVRRRTAVTVGIAAVLLAGAAGAVFLWLPDGTGARAVAGVLPPATATVTRETLVDTLDETGDLGYGDARTVRAGIAGTVTWLPSPGSVRRRGQSLYRVDDGPVVLLYGTLPAYRTLVSGTEGTDVEQFERNLHALGYRGFTVDDTYSSATAYAVRKWQKKLGVTRTGVVEPGRVSYARGPVRIGSREAAPGDTARPGAALLTVTGTARVATVELDMDDQRLARKGAKVRITLPDGTETAGRITDVDTVVRPASGQTPATTTIDVTVGFADVKAPAGLDEASVEVAFTAAQAKNVLTVPVAALLALAEGGYGVQVVSGATTRIVAVETGLFADGRVQVSGSGIAEGTVVGMPS